MKVYLNYRLKTETDDEIKIAEKYFEGIGYSVKIDGSLLYAYSNLEMYFSDEPVQIAYLNKAKCTYENLLNEIKRNILLEGTIDTSLIAGECMDFCFEFVDGQIKAKCSPWYIDYCMEDIDDYEDFCDTVGEFSEEEYNLAKKAEIVYFLETENGDKLLTEIPMYDYDI